MALSFLAETNAGDANVIFGTFFKISMHHSFCGRLGTFSFDVNKNTRLERVFRSAASEKEYKKFPLPHIF